MEKQEILTLMIKQLENTATPQEMERLRQLLERYPKERQWVEAEAAIRLGFVGQPEDHTEEALLHKNQLLWERIHQTPALAYNKEKKIRILSSRKWYGMAACLLLLVISLTLLFVLRQSNEKLLAQTTFGHTQTISLADGTQVKLNAGSSLYIDQDFNKTNRKVKLSGEAYFQVKGQQNLPFLVEAEGVEITVLGTTFNVKAYPNEAFETTLIQGKVAVQVNGDENIVLKPLEKITLNTVRSPIKSAVSKIKVSRLSDTSIIKIKEIAWLSNRLIFSNEPFGNVARQLERTYNVPLKFEDSSLQHEKINGVFQNESIEEALSLLKGIVDFDFQKRQDTIFIHNLNSLP